MREGNSSPTLCTVDLSVRIAGIVLSNPVMVASGTFGFGAEYEPYVDVSQLGAIVTKGLTLRRRAGNPPPRIWETPSGMLNCIGLQNPGLDGYLRDHLPVLRSYGIPIIVNIAGDTVEEYAMLASELERHGGADAIETNISCPNVKRGGLAFEWMPPVLRQSCAVKTRSLCLSSEAVAERDRHRSHRRGLQGCRRRRIVTDQHSARNGH